jgi:hypothetical protein
MSSAHSSPNAKPPTRPLASLTFPPLQGPAASQHPKHASRSGPWSLQSPPTTPAPFFIAYRARCDTNPSARNKPPSRIAVSLLSRAPVVERVLLGSATPPCAQLQAHYIDYTCPASPLRPLQTSLSTSRPFRATTTKISAAWRFGVSVIC